jgi:hypothetical protein
MEKEVERSIAEARKYQARGNLFDALRTLEETRHRFPRASAQLKGLVQEMQELIDIQMELPDITVPSVKKQRILILVTVVVALLAVAVVTFVILTRDSAGTAVALPEPAVLVVDLNPWGEIVSLVNTETGEPVEIAEKTTPFKISIPPGQYILTYNFSDDPEKHHEVEVSLGEREFKQVHEVSESLTGGMDQLIEEIVGQ